MGKQLSLTVDLEGSTWPTLSIQSFLINDCLGSTDVLELFW